MKKKILLIISIFILLLSTSSCSVILESIFTEDDFSVTDLNYTFTEQDKKRIDGLISKIDSNVIWSNDYDEFNQLYEQFENEMIYLDSCWTAYSVLTDIKYANYSKLDDVVTYYYDVSSWHDKLLVKLTKSKYKDLFYEGYTQTDINQIISFQSDEFYSVQNQIDTLVQDYYELSEDEFYDETPKIYTNLVSKRNRQAKLLGYSNYLEFAFEDIYYRDYSISDGVNLINLVYEHLYPVYNTLYSRLNEQYENLNMTQTIQFETFLEANFLDKKETLNNYAEYMGDTYLEAHNHLWNDGYLFVANGRTAFSGAYQSYLTDINEPILFFGPEYQTLLTYVHEFGHYYAAYLSDCQTISFDLAETHSQTNEFLFINYIIDNSTLPDPVKEIIKTYQLYIALETIFFSALIYDFEVAVYTKALTPSLYDDHITNIFTKHNFETTYLDAALEYWRYTCVDNAGYYLSYLVAYIQAINIFLEAQTDFEKTINKYNRLTTINDEDSGYLKLLDELDLRSPFDEELILEIKMYCLT